MLSVENIKVIDNFMSKEEVQYLIELCNNSSDDIVWWYQKFPGPEYAENAIGLYQKKCQDGLNGYHDYKNPILNKYIESIVNVISYDVGKKLVPIFHFNRHCIKENNCTPPHTDAGSKNMDKTDYLSRYHPTNVYEPCLAEYTAIIYLNDNYDGGNLYFPDYGIEIQHSAGQLVYFPANTEYAHGVSEVKKNTRWNLITHLTSPLSIKLHSIIYNMWCTMTDEQKSVFNFT